jgi:hypothetical protein
MPTVCDAFCVLDDVIFPRFQGVGTGIIGDDLRCTGHGERRVVLHPDNVVGVT